jgi:predicted alpha/beta-hydrolase family hydrolase
VSGGLITDVAWAGPRRDADRAVLLAHGAGSGKDAADLVAVAEALAERGIPSLRFDYPYRSAGRRAPDRPAVLEAATREAVTLLGRRSGLPTERLVLAGRSMGGRYCSQVVGADHEPVNPLGLALLAYPLHPPGRPTQLRTGHFVRLGCPVLFASGTRDTFGTPEELNAAIGSIPGPTTLHWLEGADHGFKTLKSSGRTVDDIRREVAAVVAAWVHDR